MNMLQIQKKNTLKYTANTIKVSKMEPIYTNVQYTYDWIVLGTEPNSRIDLVILLNHLSSKCNSQILYLFKKNIYI